MSEILLGIQTAFKDCSTDCKYIKIEPRLIVPGENGTKYRCKNMGICLHAAEMERRHNAKTKEDTEAPAR